MKLQQILNLNIKIFLFNWTVENLVKLHQLPILLKIANKMNTRQFCKEFFPVVCFFALVVLVSSALTYRVVYSQSSWEGLGTFKIVYLIILWTFVGSGILTTCFTALWTLFSRTMVTIKPDGDQEEPLQVIVVGPFDRRVTHL